MIIYSPLDGDALTSSVESRPRHCFLMTRLGKSIPGSLDNVRQTVTATCRSHKYSVIDATSQITGRDFLLKIWRQIASTPLCVGIAHEDIPAKTQANIYYELGVAQALGKETLLLKSPKIDVPSDFVRSEYIAIDKNLGRILGDYLASLPAQAEHYETVAEQLEKNPLLAIDYLRRAFLITGESRLQKRAQVILRDAKVGERAKNSVEMLAATF